MRLIRMLNAVMQEYVTERQESVHVLQHIRDQHVKEVSIFIYKHSTQIDMLIMDLSPMSVYSNILLVATQ